MLNGIKQLCLLTIVLKISYCNINQDIQQYKSKQYYQIFKVYKRRILQDVQSIDLDFYFNCSNQQLSQIQNWQILYSSININQIDDLCLLYPDQQFQQNCCQKNDGVQLLQDCSYNINVNINIIGDNQNSFQCNNNLQSISINLYIENVILLNFRMNTYTSFNQIGQNQAYFTSLKSINLQNLKEVNINGLYFNTDFVSQIITLQNIQQINLQNILFNKTNLIDGSIIQISNNDVSNQSITIQNLQILQTDLCYTLDSNNKQSCNGIFISNTNSVSFIDCFFNNLQLGVQAFASNGAIIFLQNIQQIIISNVNISNSVIFNQGGAFRFLNSIEISITQSQFINNTGISNGGAIYLDSFQTIYIFKSNFYSNVLSSQQGQGGAIYAQNNIFNSQNSITIIQSNIINNTAYQSGFLYVDYIGNIIFQDSLFIYNKAQQMGGGVMSTQQISNIQLINCNFSNNTAQTDGGALQIQNFITMEINDTIFSGNKLMNDAFGGAIYSLSDSNTNNSFIKITNSTVQDNYAFRGGFLYCDVYFLQIDQSIFQKNKADSDGGVLYITVQNINVTNSQFNESQANKFRGGAIYSTVKLDSYGLYYFFNCTFMLNQAQISANVIYIQGQINYYAQIQIIDSKFLNSTQVLSQSLEGGAFYIDKIDSITFINVQISNGNSKYGGAIYIQESNSLNIENSNFTNNLADAQGGVIFAQSIKNIINISNSNFNQNKVIQQEGGVLILQNSQNCTLIINNSIFNLNIATKSNGGVIYLSQVLKANFQNSQFNGNKATKTAVLLLIQIQNDVQVDNCIFLNNNAIQDTIISLNQAVSLLILNSNFQSNVGSIYRAVFSIYSVDNITIIGSNFTQNNSTNYGVGYIFGKGDQNSLVNINDCIFQNNQANGGIVGVLYLSKLYQVNITNSTFKQNQAIDSGAILTEFNEKVFISGNIFQGNTANLSGGTGGAYRCKNVSALTISNNLFENNLSTDQGGAIYLTKITNSAFFFNNTFNNNSCINYNRKISFGGALYIDGSPNSQIILNQTYSKYNKADNGGTIYMMICNEVQILNSILNESQSFYGGIIEILYSNTLSFSNSTFQNGNTSFDGGALYLSFITQNISIIKCKFIGNSAQNGGSVFLLNQKVNISLLVIDNVISNNQAQQNGAGFSITGIIQFNLTSSNLTNNTAQQSGGGVYLKFVNEIFIINSNFSQNQAYQQIKDTTGGGGFYSLSPQMVNIIQSQFFNNSAQQNGGGFFVISSQSNNFLNIFINGSSFIKNKANYEGGGICIKGIYKAVIYSNKFIQNYGINSGAVLLYFYVTFQLPNQNILRMLQSDNYIFVFYDNQFKQNGALDWVGSIRIWIEPSQYQRITQIIQNSSNTFIDNYDGFQPAGNLKVGCVYGEYIDGHYQCQLCEAGYYSLDGTGRGCKDCPAHIECPGGYQLLSVEQTYWRPNNISDIAIYCEKNPNRCLGKDKCLTGYVGVLCEECDSNLGYVQADNNSCAICGSPGVSWLVLILTCVVIIILSIFVSIDNLEKHQLKIQINVLKKLFNYMLIKRNDKTAMIKILINHLQIVSIIMTIHFKFPSQIVSVFQTVGQPTQMIVFSQYCIFSSTTMQNLYFQHIVNYIIISITYGFMILMLFFLHKYKNLGISHSFISSSCYFFVYLQPSMTLNMISMLSTREIDNDTLVAADVSIKYYSDDHIFYIKYLAAPSLVFWIFIVTFGIVYILYRQYKLMKEDPTKEYYARKKFMLNFQFLAEGYNEKGFYWEIVYIFCRLMFIIVINLLNERTIAKGCFTCLITLTYMYFHIKIKPFANQQLNNLAFVSQIVQTMTIIMVLILFTDSDSQFLLWQCLLTIVIINTLFFLQIIYILIPQLIKEHAVPLFPILNKFKIFDNFVKSIQNQQRRSYLWNVAKEASIYIARNIKNRTILCDVCQIKKCSKQRLAEYEAEKLFFIETMRKLSNPFADERERRLKEYIQKISENIESMGNTCNHTSPENILIENSTDVINGYNDVFSSMREKQLTDEFIDHINYHEKYKKHDYQQGVKNIDL